MTPPYQHEPMDPRDVYRNRKPSQPDFYMNAYPAPHTVPGSTPYPPLSDGNPQPFYSIGDPHIIQPTYDMNNPYAVQHPMHAAHAVQMAQYPANPAMSPLSPQSSSMLHSPTAMIPGSAVGNGTNPLRDVNVPSIAPPNAAMYRQVMSPTKAEPAASTTAKTADSNSVAGGSSAKASSANSKDPNQPKKKYACPHAKTAGCKDTFTTSGHAARHGKKHTGEKNVACPTCGKTFTRKDNMKQHERTHKAGHSSAMARSTGDSAVTSPVTTSTSNPRRSRAVSSSTVGSTSTSKDADGGDVIMGESQTNGQKFANKLPPRPQMKSKLSEILEQVKADSDLDAEGEMDADADEESPALDALATIAAGEIVQ